jgi:hypothetical protein
MSRFRAIRRTVATALGLAALAATGGVQAQAGLVGPNATRTFDIRELTVRPALIYISPSYLTLLEFEDLVTRVASAKGDVVSATIKDNYVYLIALAPSGSTDLLVTVATGQVALFRVSVDKNATGPRRYLIRFPTVPGEPASTDSPATTRLEVQDSRGQPRVPAPTPSTSIPKEPTPITPTPGRVVEEMPPYLQVRAVPLWDGGILTLNLTLRNAGPNSVVADQAAVRVYALDDKGNRAVLPIRVSGGGRVAPGGTAAVAVIAEDAPPMVEVVWRISEIGRAEVWTYRVVLRREQ